MAFMRVSLVELLHQALMGRIPTLEYMLSGARGLLRPRLIMPGAKHHRFPRPSAGNAYPLPKAPGRVDRTPGSCPGSRRQAGWADRWQNPACSRLIRRKSEGVDCSRV
jgi:hypothetical protein